MLGDVRPESSGKGGKLSHRPACTKLSARPACRAQETEQGGRARGCQLLPGLLAGIQIQKKESLLETLRDPIQPRHPGTLLTPQLGHLCGIQDCSTHSAIISCLCHLMSPSSAPALVNLGPSYAVINERRTLSAGTLSRLCVFNDLLGKSLLVSAMHSLQPSLEFSLINTRRLPCCKNKETNT